MSKPVHTAAEHFTEATALQAEGARVGVVTCLECGASILLDPRDDTNRVKQHHDFHESEKYRMEELTRWLVDLQARSPSIPGTK